MQELSQTRSNRKLRPAATPYVFALYMSAIMACLMCFVITAANSGINDHQLPAFAGTITSAGGLAGKAQWHDRCHTKEPDSAEP